MLLRIAIALAVVYHVLATVAALGGVLPMLRTALGIERHGTFPHQMFVWGERHLWLSGALVIALGLAQHGLAYLDNPKLWAKVAVVVAWGLNSWLIKRRIRQSSARARGVLFGVSCSALIYGTFLGVAKPLAGGVLPFGAFLAGYGLVTALFISVFIHRFERRPATRVNPMTAANYEPHSTCKTESVHAPGGVYAFYTEPAHDPSNP